MDQHPQRPRVWLERRAAAIAEVHAADGAKEKFVRDFVTTFDKATKPDCYDQA